MKLFQVQHNFNEVKLRNEGFNNKCLRAESRSELEHMLGTFESKRISADKCKQQFVFLESGAGKTQLMME